MSNDITYYAHSGKSSSGIPAQTYFEHINNVYQKVKVDARVLSPFLEKAVLIAAIFHDSGKLTKECQNILSQPDMSECSMVNHVDAGVAICLHQYKKTKDKVFIMAAYLIHAHHIGLQNRDDLFKEVPMGFNTQMHIEDGFRDNSYNNEIDKLVSEYVDESMGDIIDISDDLFGDEIKDVYSMKYKTSVVKPIDLRMALSVLVDSDHLDTSLHYSDDDYRSVAMSKVDIKAKSRIRRLDKYIKGLAKKAKLAGVSDEIIEDRNKLYEVCSKYDVSNNTFHMLNAHTGRGKTCSSLKLALRIAKNKNRERIFCVAPFTNIISQSVDAYRDAVVMKGEKKNEVINEIHSKVEYGSTHLKQYSQLWNSPVNICTSVAFFNSLFSNRPSAVRKLKQFANSVVVFDEYHTALPSFLWKMTLEIMKHISEEYNIDFIFASATHVLYWDILDVDMSVSQIVQNEVFEQFKAVDDKRVEFCDWGELKDDMALYKSIEDEFIFDLDLKYSLIVELNTIANAAQVTKHLQAKFEFPVYQLSSALIPKDRETIINKIKSHLKKKENIVLVCTSIVECGVDLSFNKAVKEIASLPSDIQLAGRVNRGNEFDDAQLFSFKFNRSFVFDNDNDFSANSSLSKALRAREGLEIDANNCTSAIFNELQEYNGIDHERFENKFDFETISREYQVIDSPTATVLVDSTLADRIRNGLFVPSNVISRYSVTIYLNKITEDGKWVDCVETVLHGNKEMFVWTAGYDPNLWGIYQDFL